MKPGITGVYQITLIKDGRCYIGSSINIAYRWSKHKQYLNKDAHHSRYLQRAWNKYGAGAFEWTILELTDEDQLIECEQAWIEKERPAFNSTPAAGSTLGYKHTSVTRARMSKAKIGNPSNMGKKLTPEHRLNISAGVLASPKRSNLGHWAGKKLSSEHCANIAAGHKGKKQSPEWVAKRVAAGLATKAAKKKAVIASSQTP